MEMKKPTQGWAVWVDGLPPISRVCLRPGVCQGARVLGPGADHQGWRLERSPRNSQRQPPRLMVLAFNVARADGGLLQLGQEALPGIAQGLEVVSGPEASVEGSQQGGCQDQVNHFSR